MASVQSNLPQISDLILKLADSLDFTSPGADQSLGRDLLGEVAVGIVDRSVADQSGPDGGSWAGNKEPYRSSRRKAGKPIGVLSGEMLSLQEVRGEMDVTPTEATMRYGTGTDTRRRAEWFTRGSDGPGEGETSGASGQSPRPFYGLDPEIESRIVSLCEDHVKRYVNELET